jgi:hypothetical protein
MPFEITSTNCRIAAVVLCFTTVMACVKPYTIPASAGNLNHLVVNGVISIGAPSEIKLSRTVNITDTIKTVPEKGATLFIESSEGSIYSFNEEDSGRYTSSSNPNSFNEQYRLKIQTADGKEYMSEFVQAKQAPPIDSIEWEQHEQDDRDIFFYVNTRDPSGQSRYYRWEYEETVAYTSQFESYADYIDGQIVFLEPEQMRYNCWTYFYSTAILLGSTINLSQDVISHAFINRVINDNSKISERYSILVKQYVLTAEGYKYWQLLKQNSEQTGNLFDPQPSQLFGNIHCVTVPDEPVLGFLSATSISQKRIFIRWNELKFRTDPHRDRDCGEQVIFPEQAPDFLTNRNAYLIAYFVTGGNIGIARPGCVDCRLRGGTTTKPSYW